MDTCIDSTPIPPPKFSFANPTVDVGDSSPRMKVRDESFLKELLDAHAKRGIQHDTDSAVDTVDEHAAAQQEEEHTPPVDVCENREQGVETVPDAPDSFVEEPINNTEEGREEGSEAEEPEPEPEPAPEPEPEPEPEPALVDVPASPSPVTTAVTTKAAGFRKGLVYLHRPPRTPLASTSTYDVIVSSLSHKLDKWNSVMRFLAAGGVNPAVHSHVWFPDVTEDVTNDVATGLFAAIATADGVALIQPGVVPCERGFTHEALVAQAAEDGRSIRSTKLVEHKFPCFSTDFATSCLRGFLSENAKHLRSGWGIDLWWSSHESIRDSCYIADKVVVKDTYNPTIAKTVGRKEMQYYARKYSTIDRR